MITIKKEVYKGMFKDNMCDGLIHLTKRDGDIWIGEFNKNILDGKVTVYHRTGEIFNITHKEGELEEMEEVGTENPAWFGNGVGLICNQ